MLRIYEWIHELFTSEQKTKDWIRIQELTSSTVCMKKMLQRYKQFWDNSQEAFILLKALEGKIVDANPTACSLYGYTREDIKDLSIFDLSAEPEGTKETYESHCKFVPFRYHKNSSGTKILINCNLTYFTDDLGNEIASLIVRPIAPHRRSDVTSHEDERSHQNDGQRTPRKGRKGDEGKF